MLVSGYGLQVPAAEPQGGILHAMRRLGRHGAGCGVKWSPNRTPLHHVVA